MKCGCLENRKPMVLEEISKGVYNIYAPAGLDMKFIHDLLDNPKEDVDFYVIFDDQNKDRWKNMIYKETSRHPEVKVYTHNYKDCLLYIVDLKNKLEK